MKTPVVINDIKIRAIVDTGAAACAITSKLMKEIGNKIEGKSNISCIMANGDRVASLGVTEAEIEIGDTITPTRLEVINSQDTTLILGNDFLKLWNANIDFESETLTLQDDEIEMQVPIIYIKEPKVRFEEDDEEYTDEDSEYETSEEKETFTVMDLEEEPYTSEDEVK